LKNFTVPVAKTVSLFSLEPVRLTCSLSDVEAVGQKVPVRRGLDRVSSGHADQ